jgi:hypothetical protein
MRRLLFEPDYQAIVHLNDADLVGSGARNNESGNGVAGPVCVT